MDKRNNKDKSKKWKNTNYKFGYKGSNEPRIVEPTQPRVNVRPDISSLRRCPYRAWKYYFPTEEYFAESPTVKTVEVLELYMAEYFKSCDQDTILNSQSISIDYKEIVSHPNVKCNIPDFPEKLMTTPDNILNCVGLAAHQTAVKIYQAIAGASNDALADIPVIQARIHNLESLSTLKQLKARSFGQFVAVKGTVVKVSNVKPLCTTMAFRCNICKRIQALLLLEYKYITPNSCDDPSCYSKSFSPIRDHPLTETTDWQSIKLQETLCDVHRELGGVPRTIEIEISRDLTDTASPGDVVTVTGIMRVKKTEEGGRFSKNVKDKCMYLMFLEGNHISNTRRKNLQDCRGANADTSLEFTELDMEGISKMQMEDDIFALLVSSVCPTIYGLEMVKAGIVLALFGGDQMGSKPSDDRIPFRGNSHVLVVGDPGMGKSQMLGAASRLAPRGVYVCGNTSTSSGLTVTLSRDSNGDAALESGALVLADQGVCCIDEFDKMGGQQQVLLEAMEQQCISIAKAGVVCSLPARCSIIAAANPVGGHYTKAKTVSENLRMGSALLSRFDLVFILVDTPNEEKDRMLSEHVMAIHSSTASDIDKKRHLKGFDSCQTFTSSLEARLAAYCRKEDQDPVPHSLAWKYIAHARKNITNITLSSEACQVLKEFYMKLRRQGSQGDGTPITTRQLESLKRLSQARAKLEMRNEVTGQDARDVVEIMKYSLHDTFSDENNSLVFSRSMHGSGVSGRGATKKLIAILHKSATRKADNMFSMEEIKGAAAGLNVPNHKLLEIVDSLNNHGFLLKKGNGKYKLQTL